MMRLFAAALTLGLFTLPAFAEPLKPTEVKKLFPGSYVVRIFNTFDLNVTMRSNGTIIGSARGRTDKGTWSVSGNQLCIAWSTWTKGKKGCSALRREDGLIKGRGFYFRA
jgi:hypothetical protein